MSTFWIVLNVISAVILIAINEQIQNNIVKMHKKLKRQEQSKKKEKSRSQRNEK